GPAELEEPRLLTEVAPARFDLVEDQSAHVGVEHVIGPLVLRQCLAHANLRQAGAVERGRVEVANALLPGGLAFCRRLGVADVAEHVAQRRSAKAQRAADQRVSDAHDASEGVTSSPRMPTKQFGSLGGCTAAIRSVYGLR